MEDTDYSMGDVEFAIERELDHAEFKDAYSAYAGVAVVDEW